MPAWLRPGRHTASDLQRDRLTLLALTLLLVATGIGLRDPWPADEPRFALIARDMLAGGEWLVPHVGNDLYADKPPLFFWLQALFLGATGSLRIAFLLPSLLSAIGCVLLVHDLARRLWNRETGLVAGLLLLITVQFVWQARQAQIDATLCFWTTLSLYGLLRHALQGPQWRWYAIGCAAAGFGVITKGVGFLPLLILLPLWGLHLRWRNTTLVGSARWLWGVPAFVAAVAVWLVPMLFASQDNPALQAYRDEILFKQTIERYSQAWHHHEPFWYFIVNVIPLLWLPLTALLPWLMPRWLRAWREQEVKVIAPLLWCVLVVLFFSASEGKRGVYVLPAVPAFVLAAAPYMTELLSVRGVRRVLLGLGVLVATICAVAAGYALVSGDVRQEVVADYGIDPVAPLLTIAALAAVVCAWARLDRALWAYVGALGTALCVVSFWVNPAINDVRSGRDFVWRIENAADPTRELAIAKSKEQYLLHFERPIVHFGHARWFEEEAEVEDAARWFSERPGRQLVLTEYSKTRCFPDADIVALGEANRTQWFLIRGGAPEWWCIDRGRSGVAISYAPPHLAARIPATP
jgi:4-amino-4-deoxy-L-arabinose transferase-like glycosyltransferase